MNKPHIRFQLTQAREALEQLITGLDSDSEYEFVTTASTWSIYITTSTQLETRVMLQNRRRANAPKTIFVAGGSLLPTSS